MITRHQLARLERRVPPRRPPAAPRVDRSLAAWCPHYLPKYFPGPPADFHAELFGRLDRLHERRGGREAIVAPRNGSKSTIVTLAYPLRCALEGWEKYVLILSESSPQANELLGHVRRELEDNPRLAADYPAAAGRGPVWRDNRIRLRNGAVVEALGRGSRIRGRRNRQDRPSLVILDDVQSNRDITSPTYRRRAWDWAVKEVILAGDRATNFLSVGSALHPEAVAVRVGGLPGWRAATYKAVHRWPDRLDLWAECERLATNLADPARAETALAFYAANRAEMERGASTYWPSKWPLYALMMLRAEVGPAAFDGEYQGVPNLAGLTAWPPELWDDGPGRPLWFDHWPEDIVCKVLALDPSAGGLGGDYQAWAMVGLSARGDIYADVEVDRVHPTAMVARALRLAGEWGPVASLVAEENATMGLLRAEFEAQLRRMPVVPPVEYLTNRDAKEVRILDAVGKYLTRGRLRVRRSRGGAALAEQGRQFPHGDHDDALDAVSVGIRRLELLYAGP